MVLAKDCKDWGYIGSMCNIEVHFSVDQNRRRLSWNSFPSLHSNANTSMLHERHNVILASMIHLKVEVVFYASCIINIRILDININISI